MKNNTARRWKNESILISIRPKFVEKIVKGEKTIEVRKTTPKETPFKCYIYCTIGNGMKGDYLVPSGIQCGKVIGEFICDKVYLIKNNGDSFSVAGEEQRVTNEIARKSCLDYYDMVSYLGNKDGYGWHISDLKIYDKPKELSEFKISCNRKNLCYSCNRFTGKPWDICNNTITCPLKSWQYVEEIIK